MAKKKTPTPLDPPSFPSGPSSRPVPADTSAGPSPSGPSPAGSSSPPVKRNPDGTFAKGHAQIGHIAKGQKQRLSVSIQNLTLTMVNEEVSTQRFQDGLADLYEEDRKGYYQVITALMKFCAPTLQSQSIEIEESQHTKTIDEKLNQLMNQIYEQKDN